MGAIQTQSNVVLDHHRFCQLYAHNLATVRAPPLRAQFSLLHTICLSRNSNLSLSSCARNSGTLISVLSFTLRTYDIQAVQVLSGSFNLVFLITFCRPVSQTMSVFVFRKLMVALELSRVRNPYSCNTFLCFNHSQVMRDRTQSERRGSGGHLLAYVRDHLVAEV
ncbi:uncharacterized protein LACBIDRAFT_310754 [Laccaria bicolor S238N-H82]|uniref:Predicted protein n=1 Tax=Laccaria bicolor (strain S238N-H82 / ATCC MYA-4686) TaxID=486041 RepID=B0DV12_LACBS|nr:uncharacterized protein LACBIDRAFT_310754 [Laccaria bicolor S238N-H82]EDR01635.1 predicted protein [Laccaria bicolor S238N-H82]|eukprot:XP_001887711.1 predicted protein [Laccaria bicolor S238N-H82]